MTGHEKEQSLRAFLGGVSVGDLSTSLACRRDTVEALLREVIVTLVEQNHTLRTATPVATSDEKEPIPT